MVILADHLEVPSRTLCLMLFMCWAWTILEMMNTFRISSKISGLFLSRIFILSFIAMMMCCVRSSAPVLELFSAAPGDKVGQVQRSSVNLKKQGYNCTQRHHYDMKLNAHKSSIHKSESSFSCLESFDIYLTHLVSSIYSMKSK